MTNRFLQQVCEFFMTNVESMDYTHSHPSTIASLSSTVQLSPVPYTHYLPQNSHHIPSSKQPPYTFLKTATIYLPRNSHHTYLLWHFHSHSEIYCHATFHRSVIMTCIIIVRLLCMII